MNRRLVCATIGCLLFLAGAWLLPRLSGRALGAEPVANLAKLDARGACVDIAVQDGLVYRAFADGTVEACRLYSGAGWQDVTRLTAQPLRK